MTTRPLAEIGKEDWKRAVIDGTTTDGYSAWRAKAIEAATPSVPLLNGPTFTATFTNDAWEFFYDNLIVMASKHLTVDLNGVAVELIGVTGNPLDGNGSLIVKVEQPDGEFSERRYVPMFHEDGTCAVWTVHVH